MKSMISTVHAGNATKHDVMTYIPGDFNVRALRRARASTRGSACDGRKVDYTNSQSQVSISPTKCLSMITRLTITLEAPRAELARLLELVLGRDQPPR